MLDVFDTNFENAKNTINKGISTMWIIMIVFAVIFLIVAVAIIIYFFKKKSKLSAGAKDIMSKSLDIIDSKLGEAKEGQKYCEYCGTPLGKTDLECPSCGAKKSKK